MSLKVFQLLSVISLLILFIGCTERRQLKLLEKSETLVSEGKYMQSVEVLRKAIFIDSESKTSVKARYRLGFAMETYLRNYEGAVENYEIFISKSGDAVSVYEVQKRIANIYFEQLLDLEKAIEGYRKLLNISPDSLEADLFRYRIAQAEFRLNHFSVARKEFQALLEKHPKSQNAAKARFGIGNTYYMEGRYPVALEALKQVLRHHSGSEFAIEAQFLMAQSLEHQGKLNGALQMYKTLRNKYPVKEVLEMRIKETAKRLRLKGKK